MPTERSCATMSVQAGGEGSGPLSVRAEPQVRRARSLDCGRSLGASTMGDLGQALAEAGVTGVDRPLAAGLRILDHQQADVGQSKLARVDHLYRDDLASSSQPRKRRAPGVDRSDEVRHHDREAASSQDLSHTVDGATEVDLSPERRPRNAADEAHQMPSATADGHDPRATDRRHDRTDSIAAEDGETGDGGRDVGGQIGLPPAGGPEVEASRAVDEDRDVEVTLLHRVADMRFPGPGKNRPVHAAHVVARLVRSGVPRLDAVAEHERGMTTVPASEDLAADGELDAAEPCRQIEAGARAGRWT